MAESVRLLRGECRLRRVAPDILRHGERSDGSASTYNKIPLMSMSGIESVQAFVNTGASADGAPGSSLMKHTRRFFSPAFFLMTFLGFLLAGVVLIALDASATTQFGEHEVPSHATCMRADRRAEFVFVELSVGSPVTTMQLLLRPDQVVQRSNASTNAKIFSSRVAESDTVTCEDAVCSDVMLLQRKGPNSWFERVVGRFEYVTADRAGAVAPVALSLGADGELSLETSYNYFLTATHLCWAEVEGGGSAFAPDVDKAVHATLQSVPDGDGTAMRAVADASHLHRGEFDDTPIARAGSVGACDDTLLQDVQLFPHEAALTNQWLGLHSATALQSHKDGIKDRRAIVELGTACASNYTIYEKPYSLYQLDCLSSLVPCETTPSVPFRRLAHASLRIATGALNETMHVWSEDDPRLSSLPNLLDPTDAFALSIVKLLLMALVASVVWIRASKATSSPARLFTFCLRGAHCHAHDEPELHESTISEDALVGALAIAARMGLALYRLDGLTEDNNGRIAWIQIVASIVSFAMWLTRYFVLKRGCESPLTKLGGSTALIDAPCSVLLAFTEPPLLVSSSGRFDPTARLLTSLLLVMTSTTRCLFAAACCGVLFGAAATEEASEFGFSASYAPILFVSGIAWIVQAASVGALVADAFVNPLSFSMARTIDGERTTLSFALFFALTAAALPALLKSIERLAETPPKSPPKPIAETRANT